MPKGQFQLGNRAQAVKAIRETKVVRLEVAEMLKHNNPELAYRWAYKEAKNA
jgi:hypothetical protein